MSIAWFPTSFPVWLASAGLAVTLAPVHGAVSAFEASASASQQPTPPSPAPAPIQSGPRVVLESLDGTSTTRALEGFATKDPRAVGGHVVRFEGLGSAVVPNGPDRAEVRLSGGERLHGPVRRGAGEALDVELALGVHARADLERIVSLTFAGRVPATWNAPLEPAREGDRLYRRKNDTIERIDGGVEEFGETGLKFHDTRIGTLEIAWADVVALFVETAPARAVTPSADAVPMEVDLIDKSRLIGTLERIDDHALRLVRADGETIALPLAAVALAIVDDGKLVFLSDLEPTVAAPAAPFGDDLGMSWPHARDASVAGTPLVVGGRTWARGLGVHAPSRVTYALDGSYTSLRGFVGVDDSVLRLSSHGSVRFRVLVDGKVRFESAVLSGGDAPVAIVLEPKSLTGARELVLEADATPDAFVADRADWLQLILVR